MLILLITAIDPFGQARDFTYGTDKLELGLEFINRVVNRGTTILGVKLFDDGQSIVLPLEAFDGSSFIKPMKELENEWRYLLAE